MPTKLMMTKKQQKMSASSAAVKLFSHVLSHRVIIRTQKVGIDSKQRDVLQWPPVDGWPPCRGFGANG